VNTGFFAAAAGIFGLLGRVAAGPEASNEAEQEEIASNHRLLWIGGVSMQVDRFPLPGQATAGLIMENIAAVKAVRNLHNGSSIVLPGAIEKGMSLG